MAEELIEHYNKRKEELGEKATNFNMYLEGYAEGYRDTKAYMIDKACEWLKNNKDSDYINNEPCQFGGRAELDDLFIEEFRKAMEE